KALDALHFLAESFSLNINFQKGDIQYTNGPGLLHAKEAFWDDEVYKRYLSRMWLRNDKLAWETPEAMQATWAKLYSVPPLKQRFPLKPEIRLNEHGHVR
ncbi:hypothetical protein M422DRAFT_179891, partial [Sphaerobolus stellatus SS14]